MPKRKWSDNELIFAVRSSTSIRQVLRKLRLVEAGGNYKQIQNHIKRLGLSTTHFTGRGWNTGLQFIPFTVSPLEAILTSNSTVQSHKLKLRLYKEGLKKPECELCGWSKLSLDGRIPVELDHINGNNLDNRIENLRILCPNCHSLQSTHRGRNKRKR